MSIRKVQTARQVVAVAIDRNGNSSNVTYQAGERVGGASDVHPNCDDQGEYIPGHVVSIEGGGCVVFPEDSIYYE